MKKINLTRGYVAIVDDEDFQNVSGKKWYARERRRRDRSIVNVYAIRNMLTADGRRTTIEMHREILKVKHGEQVDHINGNGLDNRKANLRSCTSSENAQNRRPQGRGSSLKGVSWHKHTGKWQAQIKVHGKVLYLGVYANENDAALAYIEAAKIYFPVFAWQDPLAGVGPSIMDECPF